MLQSVSCGATGPYWPSAAVPVDGGAAAAGAAASDGAASAAGSAGGSAPPVVSVGGAVALSGAAGIWLASVGWLMPEPLVARPGGSSSSVYSRSRRPPLQRTSSRKLTKGSRAICLLVTLTDSPSTANFSDDRNSLRSMPARSKSSLLASWTVTLSSSAADADRIGIEARTSWFRRDWDSISPRPKACAKPAQPSKAHANNPAALLNILSPNSCPYAPI